MTASSVGGSSTMAVAGCPGGMALCFQDRWSAVSRPDGLVTDTRCSRIGLRAGGQPGMRRWPCPLAIRGSNGRVRVDEKLFDWSVVGRRRPAMAFLFCPSRLYRMARLTKVVWLQAIAPGLDECSAIASSERPVFRQIRCRRGPVALAANGDAARDGRVDSGVRPRYQAGGSASSTGPGCR